jgi:hypothetical protein
MIPRRFALLARVPHQFVMHLWFASALVQSPNRLDQAATFDGSSGMQALSISPSGGFEPL